MNSARRSAARRMGMQWYKVKDERGGISRPARGGSSILVHVFVFVLIFVFRGQAPQRYRVAFDEETLRQLFAVNVKNDLVGAGGNEPAATKSTESAPTSASSARATTSPTADARSGRWPHRRVPDHLMQPGFR